MSKEKLTAYRTRERIFSEGYRVVVWDLEDKSWVSEARVVEWTKEEVEQLLKFDKISEFRWKIRNILYADLD